MLGMGLGYLLPSVFGTEEDPNESSQNIPADPSPAVEIKGNVYFRIWTFLTLYRTR